MVPRAHPVCVAALQPRDLGSGDDPPIGGVPLGPDAPGAIPAAERVEADPERAGRLGRAERILPRHCLGEATRRGPPVLRGRSMKAIDSPYRGARPSRAEMTPVEPDPVRTGEGSVG